MSTKGQVISYDFIFAFGVFILVILIILIYLDQSTKNIKETKNIDEIIYLSNQISEVWMREGYPNSWEPGDVVELGLMSDSRLNITKIVYLEEIGYQKVSTMLGLGDYNFYMEILDSDKNSIFTFGLTPNNPDFASKTRRISILDSKVVFLDTVVWK